MFGYAKMNDETVEKETITLYDLKFEYKNEYLSDKEKESDHKEENLKNNKFYKIDDKKQKELENVFKQVKTYIKLNYNFKNSFKENKPGNLPEILFNINKTEQNKYLCTIYDLIFFSKNIEIETQEFILFVEKLDNKDLIFLVFNEKKYELLIYRLIPEKNEYFLSQKIIETFEGYKQKYKKKPKNDPFFYYKKEEETNEPIEFSLFYIKSISRNRFFCISNYGIQMYALNEKKEYELILVEPYEKIDFIYEIDENNFIFGLNLRRVEGYGRCSYDYSFYYNLFLNKIELKNIDKKENKSNNNNLDNLKLKEKLKFSFISQTMFQANFSSDLMFDIEAYFSDFVILKNKFFIIMIKYSIFIFNMETGKEIKRFEIEFDDYKIKDDYFFKVNYYRYFKIDIKKWDAPENDEFILLVNNNVILFKLNEENSSKISLNILNY